MTRGKLEMTGMAEYLETIAQAGLDIDAAAGRALMKGAVILRTEMKRLVPKDEHNLEAHIVIDGPHLYGNFTYVEVGVLHADKETGIYGNVQEFGSASKNIKPQSSARQNNCRP